MKNSIWTVALSMAVALGAAGCKKNAGEAAGESEVNGYLCQQCKAKFYTEQAVFAEHCPGCKGAQVTPVVGFVCEKDKHVTVLPRSGTARCEQCKSPAAMIKLPREPELQAWGATKKTRADVCRN